jgi:hypothetical protein
MQRSTTGIQGYGRCGCMSCLARYHSSSTISLIELIRTNRASPPRGFICYFWKYDNLFSDRTDKYRPPRTFILYIYVSNRICWIYIASTWTAIRLTRRNCVPTGYGPSSAVGALEDLVARLHVRTPILVRLCYHM